MPAHAPPMARIRLSRSLSRLLALPALAATAGAGAIAAGLLLLGGTPGVALAAAGGVLVVLAAIGAAVVLSVRLEVEEAAVRVAWLGGERTYTLSPGPVTRVRLRGANASRLRGDWRLVGGQLGSARLRDDERIEVVRLAPTATAILVPTDRGRLAIAAADEAALLAALAQAAHARQRLEEAAREAPPVDADAAPVSEPIAEVDLAHMTGIERAVFERRMAEEHAAAEAAAAAEVLAAEDAARVAAGEAAPEVEAEVAPEATRERRRRRLPLRRPPPSAVLLLVPLVGAAAAWGVGSSIGRLPEPETDSWRLTALALVLAGPAATIGAIMARIWWPRLVGVVVLGGLAAAVLVGRSLIGA